jgi:hypothetical protein
MSERDLSFDCMVIPTGPTCYGCCDLETVRLPGQGEIFRCKEYEVKIGYVGKIMEGSVIPRQIDMFLGIGDCYDLGED